MLALEVLRSSIAACGRRRCGLAVRVVDHWGYELTRLGVDIHVY